MEGPQSLADLLDLQAVDLDIDRLLNRRQSLPELEAYRVAHGEVERVTAAHDAATKALRESTLALDRTTGELDLAERKLHAEQNRLYAGGIGAREAENLRREVEMLERNKGSMEDEILSLMERREAQDADVERLEAELQAATAEKSRLEGIIKAEWATIDAEIARKEARKADVVSLVDADLLELYEELRRTKEGVAVGRLADGVCGGCHLRLSAAEQAQVVKGNPPRCLHCRRILVP